MTAMILPIKRERWEQHFGDNSWDTIQEQIDAGFPIFAQPTADTAKIVFIKDTGATISTGVLITISYLKTTISGSVDLLFTISTSLDGETWIDNVDVESVFTSNFRYVKITIEATASDNSSLIKIENLGYKINIEKRNDSGIATGLAADVDGTEIPFNIPYIGNVSITITPKHQPLETKGISFGYDIADDANPTHFNVWFHSNLTGNRINAEFSWKATGA